MYYYRRVCIVSDDDVIDDGATHKQMFRSGQIYHDLKLYGTVQARSVMASTSAGSAMQAPTGILDEIQALFNWNPPILFPGIKMSTAARPPSFFDKHFDDKYTLKKVQRLPSLVDDLAKNVDTALSAALNTLPPLKGFFTAEQREFILDNVEYEARNESAVANFYDATTNKFCSPVASTLAIHPNVPFSKWHSLVTWTQSVSSSGYAIMDGQLSLFKKFRLEKKRHMDRIFNSIDSELDRDIFEEMRVANQPFATWEMMSLSAGSPEVMTAIPNLGNFNWVKCSDCDMTKKNHRTESDNIKLLDLGPDARTRPWRLPVCSYSLNHERIVLIIL